LGCFRELLSWLRSALSRGRPQLESVGISPPYCL